MNGLGEFSRSPAIHRSGSKGWRIGKWTFRRIGKGFEWWNGIDGKEMEHGAHDGTKWIGDYGSRPCDCGALCFLNYFNKYRYIFDEYRRTNAIFYDCGRYIAKLLRNSITLDNRQHKLEYLLIIFAEKR